MPHLLIPCLRSILSRSHIPVTYRPVTALENNLRVCSSLALTHSSDTRGSRRWHIHQVCKTMNSRAAYQHGLGAPGCNAPPVLALEA